MGREIRRVPADWQHPTFGDLIDAKIIAEYDYARGVRFNRSHLHPMHETPYTEAAAEWKREFADWEADKDGERTRVTEEHGISEFWDWSGDPPDRAYYRLREWTDAEATAYQVYENVTEGTPVSPLFQTADALEDWLVNHQRMGRDGARAFIASGWVPSGMASPASGFVSNYQTIDPGAKPFERDDAEES